MKTCFTSMLLGAAAMATMVNALSTSFDLLDYNGNLNYYHPANSPYTAAQVELPSSCSVDQVHIASRHMTRYPVTSTYKALVALDARIKAAVAAGITIVDPTMQFLQTWSLDTLIPNSAAQVENITALGLEEAKAFGVATRAKYAHLYQNDTTFWTSNIQRSLLTAQTFMDGYTGGEALASTYANLVVTNATDTTAGGNSVLPLYSCTKFDYYLPYTQSAKFVATFGANMTARVEAMWPGFKITAAEALVMMDLCMYEMNLLAKTQRRFCNIFTDDDWIKYSYNADIVFYYGYGYGNPLGRVIGYPYISAVAGLLAETTTPTCQNVYPVFTHDAAVSVFLSALGLFYDETMSTSAVNNTRTFRTSRMVPMGARMITERIKCGANRYVRVLVNEAVQPLPSCQSGPGLSCPLNEYTAYVAGLNTTIGDFVTECGVTSGASSKFAFFDTPLKNLCSVRSC